MGISEEVAEIIEADMIESSRKVALLSTNEEKLDDPHLNLLQLNVHNNTQGNTISEEHDDTL